MSASSSGFEPDSSSTRSTLASKARAFRMMKERVSIGVASIGDPFGSHGGLSSVLRRASSRDDLNQSEQTFRRIGCKYGYIHHDPHIAVGFDCRRPDGAGARR